MSSIPERYDRNAEDYERYWAPVLDASARRLLDRVEPLVAGAGRRPRILDVGTGSGVLALDALGRWPDASVVGVDASSGMLDMARRRAGSTGRAADDPRLRWVHAPADAIPEADAAFDIVVSSFVYQLVPDRGAAFREALRLLRPGGWICLVTWLDRGPDFAPAVEFDEAVFDLEIDEPEEEEEVRAGDFRSPRSAATELRRAGFRRVAAHAEALEYSWTRESYLDFKVQYDELALFTFLDEATALKLVERARERLAALPDEDFDWRAELVAAVGQRPT